MDCQSAGELHLFDLECSESEGGLRVIHYGYGRAGSESCVGSAAWRGRRRLLLEAPGLLSPVPEAGCLYFKRWDGFGAILASLEDEEEDQELEEVAVNSSLPASLT